MQQAYPINFSNGLDLKTDPFQVPFGKFLSLQNSVFTKGGLLQKRNGFGSLSTLPTPASYLTTFNGDLTAIETDLQAYNSASKTWVNQGTLQPMEVSTLPLIRNNINQIQVDSAIAPNGLICTVYTETDGVMNFYKYAIADSVTGQNIVQPTELQGTVPMSVSGSPRVFILGRYFVIVMTVTISATPHLQYVAVSYTTQVAMPAVDITSQYTPAGTVAFDGVVANNNLYLAWNGSDIGGAIRMTLISSTLTQGGTTVWTNSGKVTATIMSLSADLSGSTANIYASYYDSGYSTGYTVAVDQILNKLYPVPAEWISAFTVLNVASTATAGVCTILYEVSNVYAYDSGIPTNYIAKNTVTMSGTVGSPVIVTRSVGLASKSTLLNGTIYVVGTYESPYQNTYFLLNATLSIETKPVILAWLAYGNAGGYLTLGLPQIIESGSTLSFAYRFKDLITAVNKGTAVPAGTQTVGVYSQTGLNLCNFDITSAAITSSEIGSNLNIPAGFVWAYDGYQVTEQEFFLWPDSIEATWSATGGSIAAKPDSSTNTDAYWYQVTYEWTDNQGNAFRSAPSIPVPVTTTGSGTAGSITLNIPTLRLTYKTNTPVKIAIYRWSVAQQIYYEVTSISQPLLNILSQDYVDYTDTLSDAQALGNAILYTTGGVLENIAPPASSSMTLFDDRLWVVDAEDRNLLWFSKQVLEATPVEMSDLQTIYVAPTIGATGSTGPITALGAMDDKLLVWKRDATYYINGTGPDATGSNSQYSQPIFVTSVVGCSNQNSIVFIPQGLMFQSDKGIWLIDRSLNTSYIGAPVESLTQGALVTSAVSVPGTNQVRFTLDSGITLMYDYYFGQWGEFVNVPAVSSTIYQNLHTYINSLGQARQESPGAYLDGSSPVLLSFTTSWINLAGLQGYQRAHFFNLLGSYKTPHLLNVQIAYNYNPSPTQSTQVQPLNFAPVYGSPQMPVYGQLNPYGGPGNLEQWRIFLNQQRCQSFQITLTESYDSTFGIPPGEGFSLSGLNLMLSMKAVTRTMPARQSAGGAGGSGGLGA